MIRANKTKPQDTTTRQGSWVNRYWVCDPQDDLRPQYEFPVSNPAFRDEPYDFKFGRKEARNR